jgi:hypothetical protein
MSANLHYGQARQPAGAVDANDRSLMPSMQAVFSLRRWHGRAPFGMVIALRQCRLDVLTYHVVFAILPSADIPIGMDPRLSHGNAHNGQVPSMPRPNGQLVYTFVWSDDINLPIANGAWHDVLRPVSKRRCQRSLNHCLSPSLYPFDNAMVANRIAAVKTLTVNDSLR